MARSWLYASRCIPRLVDVAHGTSGEDTTQIAACWTAMKRAYLPIICPSDGSRMHNYRGPFRGVSYHQCPTCGVRVSADADGSYKMVRARSKRIIVRPSGTSL